MIRERYLSSEKAVVYILLYCVVCARRQTHVCVHAHVIWGGGGGGRGCCKTSYILHLNSQFVGGKETSSQMDDWVLDSLVGFLKSPTWTLAVSGFTDKNCLGESCTNHPHGAI